MHDHLRLTFDKQSFTECDILFCV